MKKLKFLFISLTSIITGLLIAVAVMAWTNPSGNPPTGGGAISAGANAPANSIYIASSTGNVGIGTTTPSGILTVASSTTGTGFLTILPSGNVGIGTTNPGARLDLEGGNIIDVNKISVNTIDPVFEIDGQKYATYMADFVGGVRVETTGLLNLEILNPKSETNSNDQNSKFQTVIDFENLEKGSDLWLFWQTSNQNLNDLAVILTPAFEGKVWYEKQGNKLIIYGERKGEISYRLSLPRLDYKEHPNLLVEGPESVFIKVKDYR